MSAPFPEPVADVTEKWWEVGCGRTFDDYETAISHSDRCADCQAEKQNEPSP